MMRQVRCTNELRRLLATDRETFMREYRIVMNLHGNPSDSENASDDEMIRALCEDQTMDEAFLARRSEWEKSV